MIENYKYYPTYRNNISYQKQKKETFVNEMFSFHIFGIELRFDDLLILGLLFFLYINGINDPMLFIALIMLLF